ncbi:MAG: hypothetical protein P8N09_08440 [Planctomycetota bacterium]|nr:hypothetical protein [Planctomycetota bacterium]
MAGFWSVVLTPIEFLRGTAGDMPFMSPIQYLWHRVQSLVALSILLAIESGYGSIFRELVTLGEFGSRGSNTE